MHALLLAVFALLLNQALGHRFDRPSFHNSTKCVKKIQRKPWQALTAIEKSSYINATLCLTQKPAKHGIPGARTLWDELHYVHVYQSPYIHFTGSFLPFHRYYLAAHTKLLTTECNYRGAMPYWNQPLDLPLPNLTTSPIFHPTTGFGGNGSPPSNCVTTGPFSSLRLIYTENATLVSSPYCLARNFSACLFANTAQANVDACLEAPTYETMWRCLEAKPHIAAHWGVGGTMGNSLLSAGDPVFFLHHGWLDSLWWRWQLRGKNGERLREVGGGNLASGGPLGGLLGGGGGGQGQGQGWNGTRPVEGGPSGGMNGTDGGACAPPLGGGGLAAIAHGAGKGLNRAITDWFGDGGGNVTTLGHVLWSAGILPNATVADIMDVGGKVFCSEYL
ncbi:putative amino acid transporter [Podospora aff. communis PSN243]|uniref:Amino acid transporter n=1 Tax=Podospora aff. communis PSN243 TaxID=3040156 RepID=A0AAV9GQR2_9PEZI|nr:putative amino acid transporter [Podospora aff. communis PSN243]